MPALRGSTLVRTPATTLVLRAAAHSAQNRTRAGRCRRIPTTMATIAASDAPAVAMPV